MKIILTIDSLSRKHGGPSHSVPTLGRALAHCGADAEVWTLLGQERPEGIAVRRFSSTGRLLAAMGELPRGGVVLHDNGLWRPFNWRVCAAARRLGIAYVISPRGMLDPWCLRQSHWKKWLAWKLYQRRILDGAAMLHATGTLEARNIRTAGLRKPIVMQPNGVDIPATADPRIESTRTVLYLSRLHSQKGIEALLDAWKGLQAPGWRLVIAGNGEPNYVARLKHLSTGLDSACPVEWLGERNGGAKWAAFAGADFFVLPSFSESFGIVVAEALGAGLPVITTTATPWQELEARGCGFVVAPEPEPLRKALQRLMDVSHNERVAMGNRGREWMRRSFSWDGIARNMRVAYVAALTGRGMESFMTS